MVKRKLYKFLSIVVTATTIATTVCPVGLMATEANETISAEVVDENADVSEDENADDATETDQKETAEADSETDETSDEEAVEEKEEEQKEAADETAKDEVEETETEVKEEAAALEVVTGENELTLDKFGMDDAGAKNGAEVTFNDDNSAKITYGGAYSQLFLKLPAEIDSKRVTKIVVNSEDELAVKVMKVIGYNADDEVKVEYNTKVVELDEGTEFAYIDLMSKSAGEVNVKSITLTLAKEDPYAKNGEYTFKFSELTLDEEASKTSGQNHLGAEVSVKDDGSAEFNFKDQYAQAFFKLPEGINSKRVSKIEFKDADPSNFSVKVLPAPGDDTLANSAGGVTYGNNALNIEGLDFAYFSAMSLADVAAIKTATAVVITLVDEPVKEEESQVITKKLSELTLALNGGATVEDGKATFTAKFQSLFFELPNDIEPSLLSKIEVKSDADKYSYKVMSQAQFDDAEGDRWGAGLVASYGNPVIMVNNNANAKYLIIMSGDSEEGPWGSFSLDSEVEFTCEPSKDVQMDIPNLKDTVVSDDKGIGADGFVGTCIGSNGMNDEKIVQIVKKHFNAVTLENELKPDSLLNGTNADLEEDAEFGLVPKALNFTTPDGMLDKILEWNKEDGVNIKVRGHVLTWHSQTPTWFFREGYKSDGAYVTPEVMTKRHEWYIKNVMQHYFSETSPYKDLFYGFDVVNEACSDNSGTYRSAGENSEWAAIYGTGSAEDAPDYIINAFRFANKYAPATLELYYNDYNDCQSSKVPAIENLLRSVKKHENDEVLPTRISGFGMQGHHEIDSPSKQQIIDCAARYGAIVDKVQVTELDVKSSQDYDGSAEKKANEYTKMGYRYKDIYDAYRVADQMGAAAEKKFDINSFTVWGTIDSVSWLNDFNGAGGGADGNRKQCPLLFDGNYQAKPAFWAIVDATKLEPFVQEVSTPEKAEGEDPFKNAPVNAFKDNKASFVMAWDAATKTVSFKITPGEGVDVKSADLYINWAGDETVATAPVAATKNDDGTWTVSATNDSVVIGSKVLFDIVLTLADDSKIAYNNSKLTHATDSKYFAKATLKPFMEIKRGTPVIDGTVDSAWDYASDVDLTVVGNAPEATAKAKVLWDEDALYVLMNVKDPNLDATAGAVHEKDSIEVFIDENNHKAGGYEEDDKQYRINYLNEASFNGTKCVEGNTQHAVTVNDDGYTVEASFAWTDITPEAGQKIGIDLQINDGKGGTRIGTVNWYDASGNGWSSPAVFGEAVLAGQDTEDLNIQYIDDAVYTGSKVMPQVVVRAYGKKLLEGTDYTLTYSNNVNVAAKKGTGLGADFDKKLPTVTIKGKGNYTKSVQANFSIVPADVAGDGFEFTAPAKLKQSGKATTPAVTVKFNGKKLAKKDYATKYVLNDGAEMDAVPANASNKDGVYYAVIKGQGNFKGTTKVALNIPATDQVAVSSLKITLPKSKAYTGSEITLATKEVSGNKAELIVKDGSKVLEQVSDNAAPTEDGYKVQYEDNIEPGLAKVTIIGNGPKYVGSVVKTFTIKGNVPFAKAVIAKVAPLTYTGEEQMINPKVTYGKDVLEFNKDYTIELVKGGTDAGAATYRIAGKGKYDGAKNVTVKINKAPANSVKVDDIDAQPYAVAGAQPEVTVKFGSTTLVKGKDYTVSYKNNKKIGKDAVATITLKGNFAGKADKKFEIVAGKIAENATMTADDVVIKNGKYQTKVAIVDPFGKKLVAGKDYDKALTYSYYDGSKWVDVDANTDAKIFVSGLKMRVTAKGIGSYQDNISAEYRLVDVLMKSAKVKIKNKDFNGKAIDLTQEDFAEISIKTSKGVEKLKLGEDFTINYLDDHTSQGTHKVEIVALECKDHNIGGFKVASFKINKKTMKWSNSKFFNKIQSLFE